MRSVAASQFVYPAKERGTKRGVLPRQNERSLVTVLLGRNLNLTLEVYSLLQGSPKNETVLEALDWFLSRAGVTDRTRSRALPRDEKKRITFIITKEVERKLQRFVDESQWKKTCVVITAVVQYLASKGVDPYGNPTPMLLQALRGSSKMMHA